MAEFKIDIQGLAELEKGLGQLKKQIKRPRPMLMAVGLKAQEQVVRTFRRQTDPVTGAFWKGRSRATIASRTGERKKLQFSGQLLKSIVSGRPRILGNTVTIGSNKRYAAIHQTGGVIVPKQGKFLAIPVTPQAARVKGTHPARKWIQKKQGIFNLKKNPRGRAVFLFGKNGVYGIGAIVGRAPVEKLEFGPVALGGAKRQRIKKTGRVTKIKTQTHWILKKSVEIKARPYLGMNPEYQTELGEVVENFLTRAIRGEGQAQGQP